MQAHFPNPDNAALPELREVQKATADRDMANRLMAMIMLLNGIDRSQVLACFGCHPNSLSNWIDAFNKRGIDGLATKPRSGRPPKLTPAERLVAKDFFAVPRDLGEEFWTKRKFHGFLKEVLRKELGYSTLARYLREDGFRLLVPRPESPDRNPEERGEFLEVLQLLLDRDPDAIWFSDEAGFLADPRPKATYAPKGTTPTCPATGLHIRESVIGAVQPSTGRFYSLVVSGVDTDVFQCFLDHLAEQTSGEQVWLVLDNASWHKAKRLNWHHIHALFLPPYSPDFNPIERLWKYIKDNYFNGWYTKSREALQDRLAMALVGIMESSHTVKSVCRP
jgi:transposase